MFERVFKRLGHGSVVEKNRGRRVGRIRGRRSRNGRTRSYHRTPRMWHWHHMWKACKVSWSFFKRVHVSQLQRRTGRTHVLQMRSFDGKLSRCCFQTASSCLVTMPAMPIHLRTSGLRYPDEWMLEPRKVKWSTDSTTPEIGTVKGEGPMATFCTLVFFAMRA